jgi:hypothetical protein
LIKRRLAALVGHRYADLRQFGADLMHHRVDFATDRQVAAARSPRRHRITDNGRTQNLVFRLGHRLPNLSATVGAFIGEVDLRHAPMWRDVLDVHRKALTAWTDHERWFGVVMVDIGWHVGLPCTPRPENNRTPPLLP